MTSAKFVGVERSAAGPGKRADSRAFLATRQAADSRAAQGGSRHRQFIAMFLPKTAVVSAAITPMAPRSRRRNRAYRPDCEDKG